VSDFAVGAYRKKPIVIHAARWNGDIEESSPIITWIISNGGTATLLCGNDCCGGVYGVSIQTLEGRMLAIDGDWIIQGIAGEFYPCKPDIFAASYEQVTE
jgi:hypothetical protein